jgi:hypothetical protein
MIMKKFLIFVLFALVVGIQAENINAQSYRTTEQERLDMKGFIPQFEGRLKKGGTYYLRRNLSLNEIADYAFHLKKPTHINPSNESWSGEKGQNWQGYALKLKEQIIFNLSAALGRSVSETEAEELFRSMKVEKVVGTVKSTGIATNSSGKVISVGWAIIRQPYMTRGSQNSEHMAVFTGPYGIFRISLVCGNSFEFEKLTPKVTLPPAPAEKIPVFCPEPAITKIPVFCPDPTTGSQRIETSVLVGSNQGSGRIETTVSTTTNTNSNRIETTVAPQKSTGGMVPAR